eukprot:766584-Hanusia_phi.AAC.5
MIDGPVVFPCDKWVDSSGLWEDGVNLITNDGVKVQGCGCEHSKRGWGDPRRSLKSTGVIKPISVISYKMEEGGWGNCWGGGRLGS